MKRIMISAGLLLAHASSAQQVALHDQDFSDAEWTVLAEFNHPGGSFQAYRSATGGNPGAFRQVRLVLAENDSSDSYRGSVVHLWDAARWDPTVAGELRSLDWGVEIRRIAAGGNGHGFGLAAIQDGIWYVADYGFTGTSAIWTGYLSGILSAGDFGAWDGSSNEIDFSQSGSEIQFGYITAQSNPPGSSQQVREMGYDNYRLNLNLDVFPGPTLLTNQPDLPVNDLAGVPQARLYWSEPVTISASDITVLTADATGQPVPFTVEGSGTQVTTITFTGAPSGPDTGSPVPLTLGAYAITVRDTARASANNAPIDGDNDGVAGGDTSVTVTHICNADLAEPAGLLDLSDVTAFIDGFVNGCE